MPTITSSSHLWNLLRGVFVVHKPADSSVHTLGREVSASLLNTLNSLHLSVRLKNFDKHVESLKLLDDRTLNSDGETSLQTVKEKYYQLHPFASPSVSFRKEDMYFNLINPLPRRYSGAQLISINDNVCETKMHRAQVLSTFRLVIQLGLCTRSGYSDGIPIEKTTYRHVTVNNLSYILSSILSNFQKIAFQSSKVDITSQEAYEIATRGLVKPRLNVKDMPLIYNTDIVELDKRMGRVMIDVTALNATEPFLHSFVDEISLKVKCNACLHSVQCVQIGPVNDSNHSIVVRRQKLNPVANVDATLANYRDALEYDFTITGNIVENLISVCGLLEKLKDPSNIAGDEDFASFQNIDEFTYEESTTS